MKACFNYLTLQDVINNGMSSLLKRHFQLISLHAFHNITARLLSSRNFACKLNYASDDGEKCDTDRGFEQVGLTCFAYFDTAMTWNEVK